MGVAKFSIKSKKIYLDANIFIYLLEGYEEFSPLLKQLFHKIYEQTIKTSELLNVCSVSRDVLIAAAQIRRNSIRLPDAIHLATASLNDCQVFLTNDKRLKSISSVEVVCLSDIKSLIISCDFLENYK